MLVAEFLGTGVLTLVVLSVQRSQLSLGYFIAIAAGIAVAGLSFIFASASGAHFNPAITIGLWSIGKVKSLPAVAYLVAQLLGGWAAYGVYTYFVNSSLPQIGGHFTARVLLAEAVGAFIFALVWAAVAAQKLSSSVVGIGLALGILVAGVASLGMVNPAVALGTRAWALGFKGSVGWGTYALGPIIGGVVGFNLYQLVFGEGLTQFKMMAAGASSSTSAPVKVAARAKTPAKKRK